MRQIITSDVFKLAKILRKIDPDISATEQITVEEEGKTVVKTVEKTAEQVGAEYINSILKNLDKAEKEIIELIASLFEMETEDFANLPLTESIDLIEEFKDSESVKDFFSKAKGLAKKI